MWWTWEYLIRLCTLYVYMFVVDIGMFLWRSYWIFLSTFCFLIVSWWACLSSYFFTFQQDVAFVVDGWALEIALKHYWTAFTELAILSRTAICCRVTPSQKAQVILISTCYMLSLDLWLNTWYILKFKLIWPGSGRH